MLLQPLALETIHERHFKSFLNSFFIHADSPRLVRARNIVLIDSPWNRFEMRESYGIRDSHSTYKTMNYYYKSKYYYFMKQHFL